MDVISTPTGTPSWTPEFAPDDRHTMLLAGLAYLGLLVTGALGVLVVRGALVVDDDPARTAANLVE